MTTFESPLKSGASMLKMMAGAIGAGTLLAFCSLASAKLPPLSDDAKAKAADTAAKAAWSDKVGSYKTCLVQDRVAAAYHARNGKEASAPVPTPPCSDPGPYTPTTPTASKPLEASEAHSPAGNATSPPSTNVPAAAAQGTK
jgi:hypothetical protein